MSVINLRLPQSLHDQLRHAAEMEGISMNQLALLAVAEKLAVWRWQQTETSEVSARASRGSREDFLRTLAQAPDREPLAGDQLSPE